jgi:hypothetical protein
MSLLHLTFLCYIQNILSLNIPCTDAFETEFVDTYHTCLCINSSVEKLNYYEKKEFSKRKYEFHFEYKKLYQLYKKWGEHNLRFARVLYEINMNDIPEIKQMLNQN